MGEESNQILKYFKDFNKNKKVEEGDIRLKKSFSKVDGSPEYNEIGGKSTFIEEKEIVSKGNVNSGDIQANYSINTLNSNQNKFKSDENIYDQLIDRGEGFSKIAKSTMKTSSEFISDINTSLSENLNKYDEKKGFIGDVKGVNLTTYGDHGSPIKKVVNKIGDIFDKDDSFISNQVEYDKYGNLKSIGNNTLDKLSNKFSGALKTSFEGSINKVLTGVGLGITSSDYPYQGYNSMFGSLAFDPGSTSKYAIVIEPPDDSDCSAEEINLKINNVRSVTSEAHRVSTTGLDILGFMTDSSYPTVSPYKDIWPSGWIPCTGFALSYGRILTENLSLASEYQFEVPSLGVVAPSLTIEILEDNRQSVRRWLKDYMEFISPCEGIVRPYKTCCCKITVLTYNKQWSRDAGDVSDSLLNLVNLGNAQNRNSNLLKFVFYAYPSVNISYNSSPTMNIDSVNIEWNIVGEVNTKANAVMNLINKFI